MNKCLDDIMCINIDKKKAIKCSTSLPFGISGHTCCVINGYIIIFGGEHDDGYLNDTYFVKLSDIFDVNETQHDDTKFDTINGSDNDSNVSQLKNRINDLNTILNAKNARIKALTNENNQLKSQLKSQLKNKSETKLFQSETKTTDDISDCIEQLNFKKWFLIEFSGFRCAYDNITNNGYDFMDIFVELSDLKDNEYSHELNINNRIKQKAFKRKLNDIKTKYDKFKIHLDNINMSQYHKLFLQNGIYNLDIFKHTFTNIIDLKKLMDNTNHARIMFNHTIMNQTNSSMIEYEGQRRYTVVKTQKF